ncbi:MerR family mercuric resistance operon transcriptional regulator [Saccharothrix carnea]|uniref:MerR family mercuric resistance operon transcriptional regulator n=1 Tax=Saccharothrix carnea TaxID=1280637 RepID=A0A2P8I5L8_SACCR|nr:MerR family transcriptional regulator [Saccharothrix carnea]PSL53758.1 MerR family mercuric resistance operon transcriptional regulator [Saccharothrix carnea]
MTGLRSGRLAEAAGVNHQTLRYYERRGLLAEPARTPGGHRLYPPEALTVLRMIKAAKRLGFTLEEIADLLDARRRRREPGLAARVAVKLTEVEARIADLETVRDTLLSALDLGCDDLAACAHAPSCPIAFNDDASCGTC